MMVNYIHSYLGKIPTHLVDSLNSISNTDPDSNIVLITDQKIKVDGLTVLKVNDIASDQTKSVMDMSLFSDHNDPLWRTSIFRIFFVRDAMNKLNIDSCIHFDSDVLLFQPYSFYSKSIPDFDGLSITNHNEYEMVFGFSKFGSLKKTIEICNILYDILFDQEKIKDYYISMPNEMQLLHGIYRKRPDLIQQIPILPFDGNEIVFDPSSYGQYFGGTPHGDPPGFAHHTHHIGLEIQKESILPVLIDKKPFVVYQEKYYPIVNLHIHSKNTSEFLQ